MTAIMPQVVLQDDGLIKMAMTPQTRQVGLSLLCYMSRKIPQEWEDGSLATGWRLTPQLLNDEQFNTSWQ
jgi:hypothetical protein